MPVQDDVLSVTRLGGWLAACPRPIIARERISPIEEKSADVQLVAFLCSPLTYTVFPALPAAQRRWIHVRCEVLRIRAQGWGGSGGDLRTLRVSKPDGWTLQKQLARPVPSQNDAQQLTREFWYMTRQKSGINDMELQKQVSTKKIYTFRTWGWIS